MPGILPGSRGSLMLDVVALSMFAVVPAMLWAIYLVRVKKNYLLHKRVQLVLATVLLAAVTLFEVEMRLHGWRHLAKESPYYDTVLFPVLWVHLFFAVSTSVLWIWTVVGALRKFAPVPTPGPYSLTHRRVAKLAAAGMCCTAVTGWTFYWMAFIASR